MSHRPDHRLPHRPTSQDREGTAARTESDCRQLYSGTKICVVEANGCQRGTLDSSCPSPRSQWCAAPGSAAGWSGTAAFGPASRGTTSIGIEEPPLFSVPGVLPGVFIVRPDGTLYCGTVQTMPFARSHFDKLPAAIDFAVAKNYPARGEYTGPA